MSLFIGEPGRSRTAAPPPIALAGERVELAGGHPPCCVGDGACLDGIDPVQVAVDPGGGPFDPGQCMDHLDRHALLADGKEIYVANDLRVGLFLREGDRRGDARERERQHRGRGELAP